MKRRLLLSLAVALVLGACHGMARADRFDFTIQGTYGETLTSPGGVVTLFAAGDSFMVQGTFDTGLQPVLETKASGDIVLADEALFGLVIDHSDVTSLTFTNLSLNQINQYYPSDADVMGDDAVKNAAYSTNVFSGFQWTTTVVDDFATLWLSSTTGGTLEGSIEYGHYLEIIGDPAGMHTESLQHHTMPLDIESYEISNHVVPVPLPGSVTLLALGAASLVGFRRKLRARL